MRTEAVGDSATRILHLKNATDRPLTDLALSAPTSEAYTLSITQVEQLDGATSAELTLTFSPAAKGVYPATVQITGLDAGEPFTYTLHLTGRGLGEQEVPVVRYQPESDLVPLGGSATFAAEIISATPIAYEWKRGSNRGGARGDLIPCRRGVDRCRPLHAQGDQCERQCGDGPGAIGCCQPAPHDDRDGEWQDVQADLQCQSSRR